MGKVKHNKQELNKFVYAKSQRRKKREKCCSSCSPTITVKKEENNKRNQPLSNIVTFAVKTDMPRHTNDYHATVSRSLKNHRDQNRDSDAKETLLDVGRQYMICRNDTWLPAEILHSRLHKQGCYEYYVHFSGLDRRLDEWVKKDRIKTITKIQDKSNQTDKSIITRTQKRSISDMNHALTSFADTDQETDELEKERLNITKIRYINRIQFGCYEIGTWYFSPYPREYEKEEQIWICEYCLKYSKLEKSFRYHLGECVLRRPPGVEVYYKESLSIWEVNPSKSDESKLYCQNLCLLAKLFLDHKTIHYDVNPFLFYILCSVDKFGSQHLMGYFSKEKNSADNNVACILILPPFQKNGYGKLLIAFSYGLSKLEGLVAGPEKPLSEFARMAYISYWSWELSEALKNTKEISVGKLSKKTSITPEDIVLSMQSMNLISERMEGVVYVTQKKIEQLISKNFKSPKFMLDINDIKWSPTREKSPTPTKSLVNKKNGIFSRKRSQSSTR